MDRRSRIDSAVSITYDNSFIIIIEIIYFLENLNQIREIFTKIFINVTQSHIELCFFIACSFLSFCEFVVPLIITKASTSLPAQEAEHVTSLALQKLLADLRAERSDLSADRFLQKRQEVMQLSVRELTETVVLYKDRLEVTLSKSIVERLELKKPACSSYPIKQRSVGKRNKVILSDVP